MKTVGEIMATDVVWVNPSARVKTAVILMKGHSFGALPVVQGNDEVVGVVTYQDVLGQPPDTVLSNVMSPEYVSIASDIGVVDAAEIMSREHTDYLLVLDDGRLKGIVSHSDLLPELGKSFDPLTGLAWSDQFRAWAISALKRGQEISIIFFDLDRFGAFNKNYGHVIGDTVLKEVSEVFKKSIDSNRDFVCRYGGDEFVIASIRNADDAVGLADAIKEGIAAIAIPELPTGISGSYGIAGGRRTNERRDIHFAATLDNLVTRASKNCTLSKPARVAQAQREAEAASQTTAQQTPQPATSAANVAAPAARLKLETISLTSTGTEATVKVTLNHDGREYTREASGYLVEGINTLRLAAEAAAGAVAKCLPAGHGIVVEDVLLQSGVRGDQVLTVIAIFITPRYATRTAGSVVIKRGDQLRAAAAAVMAAVNRQTEIVGQSLEQEPG
ncbi:MAG: CBS domain-containing protein [Armatimonadetes bacterium]|nr:CBS domain-containing protein [Armatimonadota bacterium]